MKTKVYYKDGRYTIIEEQLSPRCEQVLKMLKSGPVTSLEAGAVYKIRQLPARIFDLKEAGFNISTTMKRDLAGQRYASYSLEGSI